MKRVIVALLLSMLLLAACAPQTPAAPAEPAAESTQTEGAQPAPTDMPEPAGSEAAPEAEATGPLGAFSFTALDGTTVDNAYLAANKLTMVNYWATWCGYCVMEMPDLQRLSEDYADKDFGIVGVLVWDEDTEGAKAFLESEGIGYPSVIASGVFETLSGDFAGIPATLFFDAEGKQVGELVVGSRDYEGWASIIDELLERVS